MGWQELDSGFLGALALFDTASEDVTDTLDLVHARNWDTHGAVVGPLWRLDELFEAVEESVDVDWVTAGERNNVHTLPPFHLHGLGDEVIAHPAGDWQDWQLGVDESLLPANLLEHVLHFVLDFGVPVVAVLGNIAVHLVNTNEELLDAQKVNEDGVLSGLALDFTSLGVALGDGGGEVTVGWDHQQGNVGLRGAGDHVLDKVTVTWGVDDGVVVGFSEEFLGGARNGDTTLSLFLLTVHVEGEGEGTLSELVGFFLQLGHFSLGDSAKLENETSGGGGLAGIDVPADNNGKMSFAFRHGAVGGREGEAKECKRRCRQVSILPNEVVRTVMSQLRDLYCDCLNKTKLVNGFGLVINPNMCTLQNGYNENVCTSAKNNLKKLSTCFHLF